MRTKKFISTFFCAGFGVGFSPYFLFFSYIGNKFSDLIEIKDFQLINILSFELISIFLIIIIFLLFRIFLKFK